MMRLVLLVTTCLLTIPVVTSADTPPDVDALSKTPQALLEALDKRHNHYPTQKWTFEMVIQPPSGAKRSVKFAVQQKGSKRLVRFLEPGSVKGMSVLSKGTKMYVFSPQTENVRLVATSARRQTLLGLTCRSRIWRRSTSPRHTMPKLRSRRVRGSGLSSPEKPTVTPHGPRSGLV